MSVHTPCPRVGYKLAFKQLKYMQVRFKSAFLPSGRNMGTSLVLLPSRQQWTAKSSLRPRLVSHSPHHHQIARFLRNARRCADLRSTILRTRSGSNPDKGPRPDEQPDPKPPNPRQSWFSPSDQTLNFMWHKGEALRRSLVDRAALSFLLDRSRRESRTFQDSVASFGMAAWAVAGVLAVARLLPILPSYTIDRTGIHIATAHVAVQTTSDLDPDYVPPLLREALPAVMELSPKHFADMVSRRPTFVLFYAPWCPHCKELHPVWDELALVLSKRGSKVQLAQVNCHVFPKLADKLSVKGFPTLIIFNRGRTLHKYMGARDMESLLNFIRSKEPSLTFD